MPYNLTPVGYVRSELQRIEDAPGAWIEIVPAFASALEGVSAGDAVILLTWLHEADRDVLKVHPRSDPARPLAGVFATRSPDRPNPIGLHRVTVLDTDGARLQVGPLEAIDGTPVIDIKPVLRESSDA